MKTLLLSAVGFALLSTLAAKAQLITVNFDAPGSGFEGGTNYSGPGADTGGVTTEYWNPMVLDGTTGAGVASNDITPTAITFSDSSDGAYNSGNGGTSIALFTPYFISHSADVETLSNVPAGTYDLYIYSQNGSFANRGGTFTLGASTQGVENDGDQTSFVAGVNYTEFTSIMLSVPGSISFTYSQAPDLSGEGDLGGVQLVEIAAVPEPSTWAMLLGSTAVLLMLARLRQPGTGNA
jgi:hypothetical protein